MKLTSLLIITFILLVQQILGHGWVYSPQPRGFTTDDQISASTTGPCGLLTPTYPTTFEVEINGTMIVSYRMGTDHDDLQNPGTCTFSLATQDVNGGLFDNNVIETITPCNGGDHTANVSIIVQGPGTYYLQWKWSPGNGGNPWYSCVRLFVDDPNVKVKSINAGETVTETLTVSNITNLYYTIKNLPSADPAIIDTQNTKHLLLDASVSANSLYYVNFTYSSNYIPLTYTSVPANDNLKIDFVTPRIVSLCNIMTKIENEVFISIFPYQNSSGNFSGDVILTSTLYDAKIDFINAPDGVHVNLKKGSIAYFWTGASTTQTSAKRMVVQSDNGGTYFISGPYRQCNSIAYVRGESHCGDLGLDINFPTKQYFAVEIIDADFSGKVKVEKGTCENYSGISQLLVSIVLLFAVLLF
jgi:hypothetical protein